MYLLSNMIILGIQPLVFRGVIVWLKGEELDQGLEKKSPCKNITETGGWNHHREKPPETNV